VLDAVRGTQSTNIAFGVGGTGGGPDVGEEPVVTTSDPRPGDPITRIAHVHFITASPSSPTTTRESEPA
jgi:hypothetical protein